MEPYQYMPWCWMCELKDYKRMFALTPEDLTLNIIDCAAGPSTFNAELTAQGGRVVSCDALYAMVFEKVQMETQELIETLLKRVQEKQEEFSWDSVSSLEELRKTYEAAARLFFDDFKKDKKHQRYYAESLPQFTFKDYQFDLALCAHFLFDRTIHPEENFIVNSIKEMCRVAREARIYPLLDAKGEITKEVGPVMMQLQMAGYGVEIKEVDYGVEKKANAMLRVWPNVCEV